MEVVSSTPAHLAAHRAPSSSLRSSFAWTFAGNAVYGAGQWAILSLFAKLGGGEMLGQYALAVAVTTPALMLSHLNLRAVLATDMEHRHPLGDYVAVRLFASALGLAAIAVMAATAGSWTLGAAILFTGVAQTAENLSDTYYGALQRRDRMDRIARSMMAKAGLAVLALAAALVLTRDLAAATGAIAAGRILVLLVYDRPRGSAGESTAGSGRRAQWTILRTALPLGVVLMLVSLNSNLPRYAIEHRLGTRELGAFAAVASFMTAGSAVVNALGQAATPRLARAFSERDRARFLRLCRQLGAVVLALGAAGVAVAAVAGKIILSVLYRPEYAAYSGILVAVMAAALAGYVAATFGYIITSARAFHVQMPLFCAVAAASGAASWLLVPRFGLAGAAMALAIAAGVQLCGEFWVLRRALGRLEPAN
jgi:O-antigen/teichoic acid export membrane protein